jgi:hypothetical protein
MQTNARTYMLTIVIGDIHGMAAKLEHLLGQIDMWCAANAEAELRQLIFLGDYIDRGPNSHQVLHIVQRLQADGAICLRGNHEELMLRATESEGDLTNFLANGGDATITSLRVPAAFWRAQEWMRTLSTSHEDELRYYVHAGIRPGVPDWRKIGSALTSAEAALPDNANAPADRWIEAIAGTLALDPLEARILALALHYKLDQRVERLFDATSECRGLITRFHRDSGLIALLLHLPAAEIEIRLTGDAKLRAPSC